MRIKDHAAVVTGGASGLGAATARVLAEAGARVTVLDVNEDGARATAEAIGGLGLACDVTSAESVAAALAAATEAHGPARLCVNCAGVVAGGRVVGKEGAHDLAVFSRVIAINLIGTFNVMSQAAAAMVDLAPEDEHERGVIVNTASIAATEGQVGQAAYAASKGGVASLTLPAARDLARHGVRVMCIAPGLFETPMFESLPPDVYDALIKKTLHPHRLGRPEEFGRMVRALVENPMMNGSVVRLDGALRLEPR
ncbi:SDR family NAD(P)-dependent oxidoreductase [Roseospira marina]|uniref:SDR family NAD(P)-dependent oxidoreductase n=1 Tax=Roseospira marina TaxID=140057 RepID=A0A5M6IBU3_9PROT|nr:SDR family NAD(P)-dependent oxidoreductase [Roseospira marina]KAA5605760.1 SDR family NAD(P)-dependent oxidoreductase [Roseospira marina]MBB4313564.1 NAD(P)-dependent dehydrogenase (short-subunit alcohol dehydrogenase family) [Roseospira marina]MBB5086726.1 NAD(P)-dependent dehydrogenase (short-subunit alcohol dehydrogenase family) [Roseospira marina]